MVHVPMYYYYARVAGGEKQLWWKQYLTTMQIAQFVLDMLTGFIFWPRVLLPNSEPDRCNGSLTSAVFGQFILFSYLLLFIRFYWQAYVVTRKKQ